jgi:hypothetical protein
MSQAIRRPLETQEETAERQQRSPASATVRPRRRAGHLRRRRHRLDSVHRSRVAWCWSPFTDDRVAACRSTPRPGWPSPSSPQSWGLILFGSAGTIDYWQAWVYLAVFVRCLRVHHGRPHPARSAAARASDARRTDGREADEPTSAAGRGRRRQRAGGRRVLFDRPGLSSEPVHLRDDRSAGRSA